jgi:hypothetical protein
MTARAGRYAALAGVDVSVICFAFYILHSYLLLSLLLL